MRLGGFHDNNLTMSKRLAIYLQWLSPIQEYMFADVVNTPIRWRRVGSCCPFETSNGILDSGLLDIYEIKFGSDRPVRLFVNHYDQGELSAPRGLYLHQSTNWLQLWRIALQAYQKSSWKSAINELQKSTNQPGGMAEYLIGISYFNLNDLDESQSWFEKAAQLGHPEAMTDVAIQSLREGSTPKREAAYQQLVKAANLGSSWARLNAARNTVPENGVVTREGWLQALIWLYQATEQGEPEAPILAARLLYQEMHNPIYLKLHDPDEIMILLNIALLKDPSSAKIKYLIKEYSQNLPLANSVDFVAQVKKWSSTYRMPDYVIERYVEAISGNSAAQYAYGLDLRVGLVVPQSPEKSLAFILAACRQQHESAVRFVQQFIGWLSGEDIQHITDKNKQKTIEQALKILQTWSSK